MRRSLFGLALSLLALASLASSSLAEDIEVPVGSSIQAAVDAAEPGDVLLLAKGRYDGDVDFDGKALTIRGVGAGTVLVGSGEGPVVRFDSGEGATSVLDSVTVRGGRATRGGGILVSGADPVIVRCHIVRNRASSQGSGIWIGAGSRAVLSNSVVAYNRNDGGDPHGIEVVDAAPLLLHNTVVRNDSNGLILRGDSAAVARGNIFAWNGARVRGRLRGRGICDFSGGAATIVGNLFHRNRISALLRNGRDWQRVRGLQANFPSDDRVQGNADGDPGFRRRRLPRAARLARAGHLRLRARGGVRARGVAGRAPGEACPDLDGSPADAGFTGGPFAPGSTEVPSRNSCD